MKKLYVILTFLLPPLLHVYLYYRLLKGKEEKKYISERRGITKKPRPDTHHLIWIHAASIGEVNSILPLLQILNQQDGVNILLTTATKTAQNLFRGLKRRDDVGQYRGIIQQYAPFDSPLWVGRFLKYWRPNKAIWVEQEIWPNMILMAKKQGIPLAIINGRLTEKSYKKWKMAPKFIQSIAQSFDMVLAQSNKDDKNYKMLGFKISQHIGNLKASPSLYIAPCNDSKKMPFLKNIINKNNHWLAASIHRGEDNIILEAHIILKEKYKDILTIIAPRHPSLADEIIDKIQYSLPDERVKILSKGEIPDANTTIFIVDMLGDLPLLYDEVSIAFLGGSLGKNICNKNIGGHNPIEAIRHRTALLVGEDRRNFAEIFQCLNDNDAAIFVNSNAKSIAHHVENLLLDDAKKQAMIDHSFTYYKALERSAEKTLKKICAWVMDSKKNV